ncbi:MAG: dephospho-CoA kinase [Chloroflexi bacterium]|nr:dephospho-CoA kinase [Chloroflexota bacterium]
MIIIGLTGNIACGKSLVAEMLRQLGAEVLDADGVVHELMANRSDLRNRIVAEFGEGVTTPDGGIDRTKLGAIVFTDREAMARLESILHPAVLERIEEALRTSRAPAIVIEAIKLIEAGLSQRCDSVWVVACRPEQQLERMVRDRQLSPAAAMVRIKAQPPAAEKLQFADVIIDNSGSTEQTWEQVRQAWRGLVGPA